MGLIDQPRSEREFWDSIIANDENTLDGDDQIIFGWIAVVRASFAGLLEYNFCMCCTGPWDYSIDNGWKWTGTPDELYAMAEVAPILGNKSSLGRCLEQVKEKGIENGRH